MNNNLWKNVVLNWRNNNFEKGNRNRTKSDEQLEELGEIDQPNDFMKYYSSKFMEE